MGGDVLFDCELASDEPHHDRARPEMPPVARVI
jgi:hypothetical protein